MNLYGLVTIQSFYLPWAILFISMMLGGYPIIELFGFAVGHLWWFFSDLHPRSLGRWGADRATGLGRGGRACSCGSSIVCVCIGSVRSSDVGALCLRALLQLHAARGYRCLGSHVRRRAALCCCRCRAPVHAPRFLQIRLSELGVGPPPPSHLQQQRAAFTGRGRRLGSE